MGGGAGGQALILDTHVLVWLVEGMEPLGQQAKVAIEEAGGAGDLLVSAITYWEVAMLARKDRLRLAVPLPEWAAAVRSLGIGDIAVDAEVAIAAGMFDRLHGDPADRIITATALVFDMPLMTADRRILRWRGDLRRIDARR